MSSDFKLPRFCHIGRLSKKVWQFVPSHMNTINLIAIAEAAHDGTIINS